MKKTVPYISLSCGALSVFTAIAQLLYKFIKLSGKSDIGIIGGADYPTFSFLLQNMNVLFWVIAIVGIALISIGSYMLIRQKR